MVEDAERARTFECRFADRVRTIDMWSVLAYLATFSAFNLWHYAYVRAQIFFNHVMTGTTIRPSQGPSAAALLLLLLLLASALILMVPFPLCRPPDEKELPVHGFAPAQMGMLSETGLPSGRQPNGRLVYGKYADRPVAVLVNEVLSVSSPSPSHLLYLPVSPCTHEIPSVR